MTKEDQQLELPLPHRRVRLSWDDLPSERTPWFTTIRPPMPGWWEVRNMVEGTGNVQRWWWDGNQWKCPLNYGYALTWTSTQFMNECEWRGLAYPSPDIYPCPPYNSAVLMNAARREDVALRTMHAITTRKPRPRVRL